MVLSLYVCEAFTIQPVGVVFTNDGIDILAQDLSPLDFFFMFPPKHLTDLVHQTNVQLLCHLCLKLNNTSERDVKVSISRVMILTTKFEFTTRAVIIVVQYKGKMRY